MYHCRDCGAYRYNPVIETQHLSNRKMGNCFKKLKTMFAVYASQKACGSFYKFIPVKKIQKNKLFQFLLNKILSIFRIFRKPLTKQI